MDAKCDNCGLVTSEDALNEPKDLMQRVDPDGVMPAGECRACGALAYIEEPMLIAINNFARRQTADSQHSHYAGTFDALCALVAQHIEHRVLLSNEDGEVVKVTLPGDGFFSAVTQAQPGMDFKCIFESRQDGEYPYLHHRAISGSKVPAVEADIILYSHAKLAVKNEQSTDAAWEIVSINAKRTTSYQPPHPVTMLRNQKDYPGGSKTSYTPEQWAEAVEYWIGGGPVAPYVTLG